MESFQGLPCWFELTANDTDAAAAFYSAQFGWTISDAEMPDMTYLLAGMGDAMIAGIMPASAMGDTPPPPNWAVYIAVDDCDATVDQVTKLGGAVIVPTTDIPGTGRFATFTDPQGAVFAVLQPLPMDEPQVGAYAPGHIGHGNWIELATPDQGAGFDFYAELFGWTRGDTVPMGEMGEYWVFQRDGVDTGGMMRQGDAPLPAWMPYFGVESTDAAVARVGDNGGGVHRRPAEEPGGQWTAVCADTDGAYFGVVGAK